MMDSREGMGLTLQTYILFSSYKLELTKPGHRAGLSHLAKVGPEPEENVSAKPSIRRLVLLKLKQ
jgi:hypothetical protein